MCAGLVDRGSYCSQLFRRFYTPARRQFDLAPIWRWSQGAIQYGMPPSHSICASSPRAAGVNSALSADSRSSRSNARYWASNRADWVSRRSAGVMLAFLAQIPARRNLDNPCAPRAKIGDARRLQDAAVECRGYRAVVGAVSHKLRHASNAPGVTGRGPLESCGRWPMYWPKGCSRTRRGNRVGSGRPKPATRTGKSGVLRHWREHGC